MGHLSLSVEKCQKDKAKWSLHFLQIAFVAMQLLTVFFAKRSLIIVDNTWSQFP